MQIITRFSLSQSQKNSLYHLWNHEFTRGVKYDHPHELEAYLTKWEHPVHLVILDDHENLLGWMFIFDREGERWFSMLLDKSIQGQGYGSKLLQEAQKREHQLNGWVVDDDQHVKNDGSLYRSPIGFYLKNGFSVKKEVRFTSPQLSAVKIVWEK